MSEEKFTREKICAGGCIGGDDGYAGYTVWLGVTGKRCGRDCLLTERVGLLVEGVQCVVIDNEMSWTTPTWLADGILDAPATRCVLSEAPDPIPTEIRNQDLVSKGNDLVCIRGAAVGERDYLRRLEVKKIRFQRGKEGGAPAIVCDSELRAIVDETDVSRRTTLRRD